LGLKDRELFILLLFYFLSGAALGIAIASVVKIPALCSEGDVDCIREWVSALSGYTAGAAALAAAYFTVRAILKQTRESREQHEEFMKFEAYERLLLVEQVGNAASNALGTVTQIFHEYHDETVPQNAQKLRLYIDAAEHALGSLNSIEFPLRRSEAQGNLPPSEVRAENALPEFIKFAKAASLLPDRMLEAGADDECLRAASTHLMLAYEDLKRLVEDMQSFRKRWAHLTA
tara:strand:- start:1493 stop:2188 length:696 start_codon:yes stop_codon:yes gene_type:complete